MKTFYAFRENNIPCGINIPLKLMLIKEIRKCLQYKVFIRNVPARKITITTFITLYRNFKNFQLFIVFFFCLMNSPAEIMYQTAQGMLLFKSLQTYDIP